MWFLLIASFFLCYVFVRLTAGITRSSTCLVGKTAIVTGANSGLGYQTALNLASRGCRIIMADVAAMEGSRKSVVEYSSNGNVLAKRLDLSSLRSVREFASDILRTEERLDVLVNNAGIASSLGKTTEDGLDPVMQINYFGHFLLTHLLIDLLKKSAPSRIVFTSSALAFLGDLSLDSLNYQDGDCTLTNICRMYSNSKLALLMASDIFAEKLQSTGVTSNAVHPGWVRTPIFEQVYETCHSALLYCMQRSLEWFLLKDSWEGSQTLVHVAVSKKLENVSGKYFWDCRPFVKPKKAYDRKLCKDIWESSEKYVRLEPNEKL